MGVAAIAAQYPPFSPAEVVFKHLPMWLAMSCCYAVLWLTQELHDAMKEHVDLHHHSAQVSDEQVLGIYPTAIRRKVLRSVRAGAAAFS